MYLANHLYNRGVNQTERRGHEDDHVVDVQRYLERYYTWRVAVPFSSRDRCEAACRATNSMPTG
jgi:hypothetical protein